MPHPCLGSRTGRQPELSLQTGRRSRSCSWIEKILKERNDDDVTSSRFRFKKYPSSWLTDKIKDSLDSLHALLEHRVASGFADDDVGPLHHHDADKEGSVARELHNLPLLVCLRRYRKQRHLHEVLKKKQPKNKTSAS